MSSSSATTSLRIATADVPQANTVGRIIDLVALINNGFAGSEALGAELGIDPREAEYYTHAARILGLVAGHPDDPQLTARGQALTATATVAEQHQILVDAILRSDVFRHLLATYDPANLSKDAIVDFLRSTTDLSGSTLGRRADSILAWLKFAGGTAETVASLRRRSAQAPAIQRQYAMGEEGEAHQKLKNAIAEDPAKHLGEPLTLVEIEYKFPTNDRADVLFLDASGCPLAVEVEVDVGPEAYPGLLQAGKYRQMIAILNGLPVDGVRGMLVARSISHRIADRAAKYGLETREVLGVI